MLPFDGSLVSCNAAMSMLSLLSSWLMMAVFLASSTWDRSDERPGHIGPDVSTREQQSCGFPFLCVLFLLGASFAVCSSGFALSSKHPLKQADYDGSASYWLEATQLGAGSS